MAQAETPTMAAAASAAFGRSPIRRRAPRRAEEQGQGEQQDGAQGNHEEAIVIGDLRCLAGDLTGALARPKVRAFRDWLLEEANAAT